MTAATADLNLPRSARPFRSRWPLRSPMLGSRIWTLFASGCVSLVLAACAGSSAGFVSRDTYPAWPFIPDSGKLYCDTGHAALAGRQYVTIELAGIRYALNGSARDLGFAELDSTVWNGDRPSTLGLIEQGLALCD